MNLKNIIFVHRGKYNSSLEENTLASFRECVENHMNIELDSHILKDDSVIVFHDDNLKRVCGKNIGIKNLNYKEILNECNNSVPTLTNVLELVNGKVFLDIELKYDVLNGRLEKKVIDILKNYDGKFILKSFHPLIVWRLKRLVYKNHLDCKVGLLVENTLLLFFSFVFVRPDFVSFNYKFLKKWFFRFISKRKDTLLYTIKSKDVYDLYKDKGYGLILENYESFK